MKLVDTSVVVAAYASWHPGFAAARGATAGGVAMVAHSALESYSVLTRLPVPMRVDPRLAAEYLLAQFPGEPVGLPPGRQHELIASLAGLGVVGGAVYDALVGVTAREAGAPLLTRDRRAVRTYERLGVAYELVL